MFMLVQVESLTWDGMCLALFYFFVYSSLFIMYSCIFLLYITVYFMNTVSIHYYFTRT